MEQKDVGDIAERISRNVDVLDERERNSVIDYVRQYVRTGNSDGYHVWPYGEAKVDAYAALLGLDALAGRVVLEQHHMNKLATYADRNVQPVTLGSNYTVNRLLNDVANQHASDDFANDFHAGIALQLDDTDCVAFGMEQDEFPGICQDCDAAGYDDAFFSCGHADYTYETKYWFMICKITDLPEIDWERGTRR